MRFLLPRADDLQVAVVLVAAGSGRRLGLQTPKAFVQVGSRTLVEWALKALEQLSKPVEVVIVVPEGCETYSFRYDKRRFVKIHLVKGRQTRQESVKCGLAVLPAEKDIVLIHDVARCFTPGSVFERVIEATYAFQCGVVPGLAVVDTLKRVEQISSEEKRLRVVGDQDRQVLHIAQTPQGFPYNELKRAYDEANDIYTDDAGVFLAAGGDVQCVEGSHQAFKITTPEDLERARYMVGNTPSFRTGFGSDTHGFDEQAPLWLAGLYWENEPGLSGHSDGDVVAHAITDALLSAAQMGDIGEVFGTDRPEYANAAGKVFLTQTRNMLSEAGFSIVNVSVQIVGNAPCFAPRRVQAQDKLSDVLGAPVSITATTTDGLGLWGRSEGVSAFASALILKQEVF